MSTYPRSSRTPRSLSFAIEATLLLAALGWCAWQARAATTADLPPSPPPLRAEPYDVRPLYDEPAVVSDADLRRVLPRLALRDAGKGTVIGNVEHALREWGPDAELPAPYVSGRDLLRLLTDNWRFLGTYGPHQPPLLLDDAAGAPTQPAVAVRSLEGVVSSPHVDHTLASLAEAGLSLDQPLVTPGRRTTLRSVLVGSLRSFHLNQAEYEWSALAYALYLPPVARWRTVEGQEMTFDRLARRIEREELPRGVCWGNHRLHALVVFLRIDDRMAADGRPRILSPAVRKEVVAYLRAATGLLVAHQHPDGFWNGEWPTAMPRGGAPSEADGDRLSDRLIATGHALEWWSVAPREILPPLEVRARAAGWLVRTVDGMSAEEIQRDFSFLSHAGRALAQWRGTEPADWLPQGASGRRAG